MSEPLAPPSAAHDRPPSSPFMTSPIEPSIAASAATLSAPAGGIAAQVAQPAQPVIDTVDRSNAAFYTQFRYPWQPHLLERAEDDGLSRLMLNQDVGDWTHQRVPPSPRIWVAGCGTNQAVTVALRFPDAQVIGSDVSPGSLEAAQALASALHVTNLQLRQESLNHVDHEACFDYIVCTGVIHHTAAPVRILQRLMRALRPDGILELMVYNRYHRFVTTPFQRALRLWCGDDEGQAAYAERLRVARALLGELDPETLPGRLLGAMQQANDVELADLVLQPLEDSYTFGELSAMLQAADLEMLTPCAGETGRVGETPPSWEYRFAQADLQRRYDALPDRDRWELTSLLRLDRSPMLWFYCGRRDRPRQSEREICDAFLAARPERVSSRRTRYVLDGQGRYQRLAAAFPYPRPPARPEIKSVLSALSPGATMRDVLRAARLPDDPGQINELRLRLATSACPHIIARTAA